MLLDLLQLDGLGRQRESSDNNGNKLHFQLMEPLGRIFAKVLISKVSSDGVLSSDLLNEGFFFFGGGGVVGGC